MSNQIDRRKHQRTATNTAAFIVRGGKPGVRCNVVDQSEGGALIELGQDVLLPLSFALSIAQTGMVFTCEVRHRLGNRLGVAFTSRARTMR